MTKKIDLPADGTVVIRPNVIKAKKEKVVKTPKVKAEKVVKPVVHTSDMNKMDAFYDGVKSLGLSEFTVSLYRGEVRVKHESLTKDTVVPSGFTAGDGFVAYKF